MLNRSESKYFNTAAKMHDALLSILKEKSFEYITISEICKKAGVNRSTFYLHYENTADLLEDATKHLFKDFLSCFPVDRCAAGNQFYNCELSELNYVSADYLYPYLSYIQDNKHVFSTVLKHGNTFRFEDVFQRLFQNIFDPILSRFGYPVENRQYVMRFYLNGIHAIVAEWLKEDCSKSIEEISQIIYACIFGLDKKANGKLCSTDVQK